MVQGMQVISRFGSIRYGILAILFAILLIHSAGAAVTPTLLVEKTINITGTWQQSEDSHIVFSIPDFTGFQQVNITYNIHEKDPKAPTSCGLFFPITTEEYYQKFQSGSPIMYQLLSGGKRFGKGVVTFDPRVYGSSDWMKGRYRLLVYFQPANCIDEATIRVVLLQESGAAPAMTTGGPVSTMTEGPSPPPATSPSVALGQANPTDIPTTRTLAPAASPTPAAIPLGTLPGVIAMILGTLLSAFKRRRD